jgi:predicted nucleotidyltransferase component of viral defense system
MLTLDRITQRADEDGVDADVVERDYVLTHVVASMAMHPDSDIVQFKGGTSLRLCYFPD